MSPRKSLLITLLVAASACGRQVVDFAADAGIDSRADASSDGPSAVRPVVTSTIPSSGATSVALATTVQAVFSKQMNPATLTMATFTVRQGATTLTGAVVLDLAGTTATFTPALPLEAGLVYSATITLGAQDTTGLTLAAPYMWMFTTGAVMPPPTVTMTTPGLAAINVPVNVSPTATFSQPMNGATIDITTFTLAQGATSIGGAVTYDLLTSTATFNPTSDLTPGLVYTATISVGAQNTNGVPLALPYTWMFTTVPVMTPPTVTMTTPAPAAVNVPVNVSPTATFSQPMNAATIDITTFTLAQGATSIGGAVTYDLLTSTATFNPTFDLTPGLVYTATIGTGAQNTNGVPLALPSTWMFTVGTACILPPVVLGASGAFAVLAGATVTNTGPSVVTGDLGVWPASAITGFPPGMLVGTFYAGVTAAMTAEGDLTIAYNNAAGRTECLTSITGDLGGMTLVPGLYKSTGFFEITTADLVLDAQGDPNAVWIFSMASALTVASSRQVTIIGGGSAANVYWQVGSSAVLGTAAVFKGTIMADQSISLATGASIEGRALARIGAVTLDTSVVLKP